MTAVYRLDEIRAAIDPAEVIDAVERGFVIYSRGLVDVPPVGLLHFDDPPGDVHIKYGSIRGDDVYVVKVASGFYNNPLRGLPTTDGVMLVSDARTGMLRAVLLDEGWLTDLRTGAAGAVAARRLAPPIERVGMIGAGVQARFQLRALSHVTDCRRVVVWSRSGTRAEAYQEEMGAEGWDVEIVSEPAAVAAACNLVVTVTPATEPLLGPADVRPGTHITALGSDNLGKQELAAEVLARADRVIADSIAQAAHHGECSHALAAGVMDLDRIEELGTAIEHARERRRGPDEITVADLTGVAVQDIAVAKMAYRSLAG